MKALQLILLFCISINSLADWNTEEGYQWQYDCESPAEISSVVFLLHETGVISDSGFTSSIIEADNSHPLFPSLLESCSLLVAPESGVHRLGGVQYHVWDYTGYFTYGQDVSRIIQLIGLAKQLFNKPIYLVGGASGGIMSYSVATQLVSLGHGDLLSGLVLMDVVSYRSLSVLNHDPAAYDGLNSTRVFGAIGVEFYQLPEDEYTYVQLGFVSDAVVWTIPTLIIYSREDPILPEYLKEDFANSLQERSTQTDVFISGFGHDIGSEGLLIIKEWMLNSLI